MLATVSFIAVSIASGHFSYF